MAQKITIKATPNYGKRTFTIRKYDNGKVYAKFRTYPMPENEFYDCLSNTQNDWQYWLNHVDGYSIVKWPRY